MWPFLNNVITTCPDSYCTPASSICYTGPNLSCIGVNQNDTLSVALQKINALMCEPITSAKIIEALGYTPANDANVLHKTGDETKNGSLTVNDDGSGYGVLGYSPDDYGGSGVYGISSNGNGIHGNASNGNGVYGISANGNGVHGNASNGIGVYGNSNTNLAGYFNTNTGAKIVSFLANSVEQAYILATGLFKANKILVNTTTDNGVDILQVNGTISSSAATTANQVVIKSQLDTKANDANVLHKTGSEEKNGSLYVNDTGDGVGIKGYSNIAIGVYGQSTSGNAVKGESSTNNGVYGYSSNSNGVYGISVNGNGVRGYSSNSLGGLFSTNSGTKIVSFLTNNIEQAYILASGLFKANKILINTTTDNDIDALQVNGSVNVSQYKISALNTAPATSTSTGTLGEIRITATHIYVCTTTNTWVRTALTTWV